MILNLTSNPVDIVVTRDGVTLVANATGATYQWLDSDNNFLAIPAAINNSFTASINGNYAVEITQNGCADTSASYSITNVGFTKNDFAENVEIYPNPTKGNFTIDLGFIIK